MPSTKNRLKTIANSTLGRFGARVVSASESNARAAREAALIDALYGAYCGAVFPELPANPRRRELLASLRGTEVPEAMFLLNYLHDSLNTGPGDVVEMGVAQGATSALIANELMSTPDRRLWLYDSFKGLSQPAAQDELLDDVEHRKSMAAYAGAMASPRELVEAALRAVDFRPDQFTIVPGFIADSMQAPATIAFAYLDFDLYEPILTGLRLLHPHTREGSVLMVDDYRYFSSGVEKAIQVFLTQHPVYDVEPAPSWAGNFCALKRR